MNTYGFWKRLTVRVFIVALVGFVLITVAVGLSSTRSYDAHLFWNGLQALWTVVSMIVLGVLLIVVWTLRSQR